MSKEKESYELGYNLGRSHAIDELSDYIVSIKEVVDSDLEDLDSEPGLIRYLEGLNTAYEYILKNIEKYK